MARKISVEIVGDADSLQRSFRSAGISAKGFDRELSTTFRGVAAGSGVFRSLGRSIAFAGTTFLGFATVAEGFRKSIDAARDAEVAQRSLAAQLKVSGASFEAWRGEISKSDLGLARFGFTSADAEKSLTVLDRATGNVVTAMKLQGVTADVARAKGIDLAAAAIIVGKAFDGQTTSLKRLGVEIPKGVTGMQAINLVAARFAGQAKANTTIADKFSAALSNTETIIGTALLPILNKYLAKGSAWLDQLDRSGKLQRDVNKAIKDATDIVHALEGALRTLRSVIDDIDKVTGGFKNTLEILIGLKVGSKVLGWAGDLVTFRTRAKEATGAASGLSGAISRLAGLGPIKIPVALTGVGVALADLAAIFASKGDQGPGPPGDRKLGQYGPNRFPLLQALGHSDTTFKGAAGILREFEMYRRGAISGPTIEAYLRSHFKELQRIGVNVSQGDLERSVTFATTAQSRTPIRLPRSVSGSTGSRSPGRGNPISRSPLPTNVSGSAQTGIIAPAFKLPRNVSGSAATEIRGLRIPQLVSGSAQVIADSFTEPLRLVLAQARASALGLDLTPILKQMRTAARKALKSGKLAIDGQIQAWDEIASINSQLAGTSKSGATAFRHVATQNLFKGLGLSRDQLLAARAEVSVLGPADRHGRRSIPHRSAAFALAGGTVINIQNLHSAAPDYRALENELQRRARSRPQIRRGAR